MNILKSLLHFKKKQVNYTSRFFFFFLLPVLRTLMGHKASITSLGFHPFGDFLASSSMDTNIKVGVSALCCYTKSKTSDD